MQNLRVGILMRTHFYHIVLSGFLAALPIGCTAIDDTQLDNSSENKDILLEEIEGYGSRITSNSKNHQVHLGLGWAYFQQNNYSLAISQFNASLKILKTANAYIGLGLAYEKFRRHTYAVTAFQKAIELEPGYCYARFRLGVAHHNNGAFSDAMKQVDTLITLDKKLAKKLIDEIY